MTEILPFLGMRADWILTEEERVNKRQKIDENRRLRQTLYPDSPDPNEVRKFSYFLHLLHCLKPLFLAGNGGEH